MKKSFSQLGQDTQVVNFYKGAKNGYFVDIGANDGVTLSNTFLLEKEYGWTGICVEPIPNVFKNLQKTRSCHCENKAAFHTDNLQLNFSIAKYNLLSGITDMLDIYKSKVLENKCKIQVETITLNTLLEKYNAPPVIEYLSIDTEGSEYEILKNINFEKYIFGLIDVEHNFIEPRRTEIRTLLESVGYKYIGPNEWDDRYVHESSQ